MRVSIIRLLFSLILILFVYILWLTFSDDLKDTTCYHYTTDLFRENLHELTFRVHSVLNALKLTHVLCYDALWGQIRVSAVLPWKSTVEMCVLNEEFANEDEVLLQRVFKKHGMLIEYISAEGIYLIRDPSITEATILLVVFEINTMDNNLRRVGWKRRILPPDCELVTTLNCFPPRLLFKPLPLKEFGNHILPVPKEGIEIQKYHYPDTWWKESKPKKKC